MKRFFTALALTALVGVFSQTALADKFAAGDVVAGETITAEMADWLNTLKGPSTTANFVSNLDNDGLSIGQEYLLNTHPQDNTTVDFRISSVAVSNVISMDIELVRKDGGDLVTAPINGRLVVQQSATPDGTFSGGFRVDGNSVSLPLKDNETQKYYRAAVVRNVDYLFAATVPLKDPEHPNQKYVPDGEEIARFTSMEITEDTLRATMRVEFPCDDNTMCIAVPMSLLDKIAWYEMDGGTQLALPNSALDQGMDYEVIVNQTAYKVYLWDTIYGGTQEIVLKHK